MPAFASSVAEKRSIFIGWSAPDLWKRNGIITHYIIEWEETGNLTTLNYSVPNPTFNTTNRLSYNFTGMRPFTTYNFRIAAVNINGTGPFSNNTKIGTDEDGKNKHNVLSVEQTLVHVCLFTNVIQYLVLLNTSLFNQKLKVKWCFNGFHLPVQME